MSYEFVTLHENTDRSAMRTADEALGLLAAMGMHIHPDFVKIVREAQRRLRLRTNPEMFDEEGNYR